MLLLGDLNAYPREDAISTLVRAGYTDLIHTHIGADAYTYRYRGWAGVLDHAFASERLAARVRDVFIWHIAADEPSALGYDGRASPREARARLYAPTPWRASDHDPVVVDVMPE